eukprot:CFRG5734T1
MSTDIKQWFNDMPPITKVLFVSSFGLTLAVNFGMVNSQYVLLSWGGIYHGFELLTPFAFYGKLGFPFIINMIFLFQYSKLLETETYEGKPADYIWMLMLNGFMLIIVGFLWPLKVLSISLLLSMVYVWCQLNKDTIVSFFFGLRFKAQFFPWVLMGFNILMGGYPILEFMGVMVGHGFWFITYYYPENNGWCPLATPQWLRDYFPDRRLMGGVYGGTSDRGATFAQRETARNARPRGHDWGQGHALGNQ